ITPVALPFILVDCPCLSWIGHDHSKTQLLQKAAHPRTVRAGFHHRSGAGITSCHGCELLARIAQTSLSGYLPGFVQHAIRVPTVTKVQSDRDLFLLPSGCVIHKASSLPTRSMARGASSAFSSNLVEKERGGRMSQRVGGNYGTRARSQASLIRALNAGLLKGASSRPG